MHRKILRWLDERLGRRCVLWSVGLALFSLILCFVPLFDLLGYDFSFAIGLATAFAAADIAQGVVASSRRAYRPTGLVKLTRAALVNVLVVLVLPLLFSLMNAARVRNCNLSSGLGFYLLLPVSTAIYATVAGVVSGLLMPQRGRVLALCLPVVSVIWALMRLYQDPAVFAFDPFGGYFPGPIYDEALRPPERLLWYRGCNMLWAGAALAIVAAWSGGGRPGVNGPPRLGLRPGRLSWPATALAAVLGIGGLVAFENRGAMGFHIQKEDVAERLSRVTESSHFRLYTDPLSGQSPQDIELVHRDLEFRYRQLLRILGAEPDGRVTVYQFPSAAAKKDLVGAGNTLYAKPWTREIFVQVDRFPAGRLRHELAHVFASAFGDPVFGVSFAWRRWGIFPVPHLASGLVEGVAEAADFGDPDGRATVHQEARAMIAEGQAPALETVVGAGFSAVAGARAYTLAGSFTHFLLQERGAERLRALYRSAGDFQGVYGEPLEALESKWRAFLERQPLDAAERARAQERFRRPAIFRKVCARELAARVAEARARMWTMPEQAVALLQSACADDPNEPSFKLDLADALVAAGRAGEAVVSAGHIENDQNMTWPLRARAASLTAAIHFHAGRFTAADEAVRHALTLATDEAEERNALAKLRALADPLARRTLGRVLFGESPTRGVDPALAMYLVTEFARSYPDEAMGPYLLARQLAWRDPRLGLAPTMQACPADPAVVGKKVPLPGPFLRECLRMTADTAFRADDLGASRFAVQRLKADATNEAERLRADDFLERIAWEEQRRTTR